MNFRNWVYRHRRDVKTLERVFKFEESLSEFGAEWRESARRNPNRREEGQVHSWLFSFNNSFFLIILRKGVLQVQGMPRFRGVHRWTLQNLNTLKDSDSQLNLAVLRN